jgi:hypothetical protein
VVNAWFSWRNLCGLGRRYTNRGYQLGLLASFSRCATTATRFRVRAPWMSAGGEGVSSVQADPGFLQPQPQVPLDLVPSTFHTGVLKWSSAWKGVVALDICVSFCEDFASSCVQACGRGFALLGCGLRFTLFFSGCWPCEALRSAHGVQGSDGVGGTRRGSRGEVMEL